MKEESFNFIRTDQIDKIIRSVKKAISEDGWIAVIGAVGTGKTTIKEYLRDNYLNEPNKYAVVDSMSYIRQGSRLGPLMKRMIKVCAPDGEMPKDIELRAERLKTILMRSVKNGKRIILILDECQDMSEQTIRELKKLHEISALGRPHLFSIIMFGKDNGKLDEVFSGDEIGYRCRTVFTHQLTDEEMISFAEERFGLKFPTGKERNDAVFYFCEMCPRTPLGIRYFAEQILDFDSEGIASMENIRKARLADIKKQMRRFGITYSDIAREVKDITGKSLGKATISEVHNGKPGYSSNVVDAIWKSTQKLIGEGREKERAAV